VTSCGIDISFQLQFPETDVAAGDNVVEHRHVDIAPGEHGCDRAVKGRQPAGLCRGDADHAGALGDQAVLEIEGLHRVIDLCLGDEHDVVQQFTAHGQG